MTNAELILRCLDKHLTAPVELTLYGRAALVLGFDEPPEGYALSHDVDAVLWIGTFARNLRRVRATAAVIVTGFGRCGVVG